jgi:hypothetical protein
LFKDDQLASAKAQFRAALLVKPDEKLPVQRMNDIDALIDQRNKEQLAKQSETDQSIEERAEKYTTTTDYNEAIKKADDKFGVKDYSVARFYYYKALEIKPAEEYPKKQIDTIRKLIDSQLSAVDLSEYNKAIVQADNAFSDKNYAVAKFFYYKALDIKSWEEYPKGRINEILALTNSLLSEREEKEYRDAIAKADEAFVNKDMVTSRFYYNMALNIKRDEDYPRIKLKDIQKLLAQGSVTLTDEQYKKFVDLGDEALQLKNYTAARFNYNKALTLKPDEKYPKDQLKKIKAELENPAK